MGVLASYVRDAWWKPADEGRALLDASTGEEVARVSTRGLDTGAMVRHAREVGGPGLRALGFQGRAALLSQLAEVIQAGAQRLHEISLVTGATRRDAWFDVEGGIGVLRSYASLGRRSLPEGNLLLDGGVERLDRKDRFAGRHVLVPRRGVEVQINAFNFPVWGPLEKLAPALLAGVPTIIKPATQTAMVTHLLVELMVESGLLPAGAIQFVAGSLEDLLDHLGPQDLVTFTGSASTAQVLRRHPAVLERGAQLNVETDSLNASILGPDARPGTPEFGLFVDQLIDELTIKAGQRCTAIRRALVPAELLDAVAEAAAERLSALTVGDPRSEEVAMGPLASLGQRDEVRARVAELATAARVLLGEGAGSLGVRGNLERGAFLAPTLLRAEDPEARVLHEVEAFGPVATLIPYRSAIDAASLAARGRGSLVASVVSADEAFVVEVVGELAPWHGRILVLDRDSAPASTGHGSPLPRLLHGGPGRAGGGQELGGMRSVLRHLAPTALQASPKVLTAVGGQWVPGAPRFFGEHPFRKPTSRLRIGDAVSAGPRLVTEEDIAAFAALSGDHFYAHTDPEAAARNPIFGGIVAHGYLVVALAAGLFVQPDPGPVLANYGIDHLRFVAPVRPGDELFVTLTAKEITPRAGQPYDEVRWDAQVTRGDEEVVARYDVLTMVARTWPPEEGHETSPRS